ncbi:CLIP domain-containing serine protease B9-like [Gigantopelta aegis]|uniref:CLIP domain-containing serine protease B9-like n=1 Tax=Gigantopelta aegis TaxID=1735272 RepID=UPI001B88E19A|nr:CLIP domain-containing serine protease B9-like [Gigantopelta aegis]
MEEEDGVDEECGLSAISGRIFGGVTFPQCEWPFSPMVSLRFFFPNYPDYTNGNLTLCAGAILNNRTILTTAVCAGFINTFSANQQSTAAVVVGEYDTRTTDTDPANPAVVVEEMKLIAAVRIHPNYDRSTLANNLAMLRLTSPIQYHRCKVPACMPDAASSSDDCLQNDDTCMMAAWGTSSRKYWQDPLETGGGGFKRGAE